MEKNRHILDIDYYVSSVLSNKIPACVYIKCICKKYQEDIKASADKKFPYYFHEESASRAISFIEKMVHVEGELTGTAIKLEPWQKFFVGSIFGWKKRSNNARRYREAALIVPRKNAKTTLAAAIGHYMLVGDGEKGSKVYCGATTEEQAFILFNIARNMVIANNKFERSFDLTYTKESIFCNRSLSFFKPIIGSPKDGTNPQCAIIDEYHEHIYDRLYNSLKYGMGARKQPLLLITTTAGTNTKGPCHQYVEAGRKVVQGVIENDQLFYMEYTVDETDEPLKNMSCWKKANPNYGVAISEDFIKDQFMLAKINTASRSEILTKILNIWTNESSGWIDYQKWLKCASNIKLEDFEGDKCWIGVDLASKIDLTSVVLCFHRNNKFYFFCKNYLPSDTINKAENEHYRAWREEGWLTQTEGARTDYRIVEEDLQKYAAMFDVKELAYDPREAEYLMQNIRDWADFPCVEFNQSATNFSEPMKEFEALYLSNDLVHENNPIMNWAAANALLKSTTNKLSYITKSSNDKKIDPIVAAIMALARCMSTPKDEVDSFIIVF